MSPLDRKARASRRGALYFADTVEPVRSVVLDRAEALEEDAREAEGDRGDIVDTDLNDILYECIPADEREGE